MRFWKLSGRAQLSECMLSSDLGHYMLKLMYFGAASSLLISGALGQPLGKPFEIGERLGVGTIEGAKCTLKRDGGIAAEFVAPITGQGPIGESRTFRWLVIPTTSHADILVTCTEDGFEEQSKTLVYGPETWILDRAPCAPPDNYTQSEKQAYCSSYKSTATGVVMEYPETVQLLLKPKPAK